MTHGRGPPWRGRSPRPICQDSRKGRTGSVGARAVRGPSTEGSYGAAGEDTGSGQSENVCGKRIKGGEEGNTRYKMVSSKRKIKKK